MAAGNDMPGGCSDFLARCRLSSLPEHSPPSSQNGNGTESSSRNSKHHPRPSRPRDDEAAVGDEPDAVAGASIAMLAAALALYVRRASHRTQRAPSDMITQARA